MSDEMTIPELDEINRRITANITDPARKVLRFVVEWCDLRIEEIDEVWHTANPTDSLGIAGSQNRRATFVEMKEYLESHIRPPKPKENSEESEGQEG